MEATTKADTAILPEGIAGFIGPSHYFDDCGLLDFAREAAQHGFSMHFERTEKHQRMALAPQGKKLTGWFRIDAETSKRGNVRLA